MLLQLLQDNEGLSHRLSQLEHLEHQAPDRESSYSNLQKRFSILSTDSGNRMFEFESDLRRSAVYRKVRRMATLRSNRSSVPESPAWTTLTEVTLSDISAASVMDLPLPISSGEISSLHHYLTTQNPSEETLIAPSSSYTEVTEPYTADKPSRNVSVHGEVTNPTDQSYMSSSSHENAGGKAYPVYDEGQSQTTLSSVLHPDPEIYKQAAEHWRPDDVYINRKCQVAYRLISVLIGCY